MNEINYPHNIQAEQMVLGALLTQNHLYHKVSTFLRPDHFYDDVHQRIYASIARKINEGELVTPLVIKLEFDVDPSLQAIGGAEYLARLAGFAAAVISITAYAEEVLSLSKRRRIIDLSRETIGDASNVDGTRHITDIEADCSRKLAEVISDTKVSSFRDGYHVADEILKNIGGENACYSTGIRQLDQAMEGGVYPGCVYAFGGVPKSGKTILGCTIAANIALLGVKIGFVSIEMTREAIIGRVLCRLAQIYPSQLRAKGEHAERIKDKIIAVQSMPTLKNIEICYEPGIEFEMLKHRLHYLVHTKRVKGFVLDYWQIVEGCPKFVNEANHLSNVAQWISGFCKRENVFGIILLQQNEDGTLFKSRGINRATEQLYSIHRCGEGDANAWLEMEFSRYSAPLHVGTEDYPAFFVNPYGPYFQEV